MKLLKTILILLCLQQQVFAFSKVFGTITNKSSFTVQITPLSPVQFDGTNTVVELTKTSSTDANGSFVFVVNGGQLYTLNVSQAGSLTLNIPANSTGNISTFVYTIPAPSAATINVTNFFTNTFQTTLTNNFAPTNSVSVINTNNVAIIAGGNIAVTTNALGVAYTVALSTPFDGSAETNKIVAKSSNYTLTSADSMVLLNGALSATMPSPSTVRGAWFIIQCASTGTNAILPSAAETFLGPNNATAAKWTNSSVGKSTWLTTDGSNWKIIKTDN